MRFPTDAPLDDDKPLQRALRAYRDATEQAPIPDLASLQDRLRARLVADASLIPIDDEPDRMRELEYRKQMTSIASDENVLRDYLLLMGPILVSLVPAPVLEAYVRYVSVRQMLFEQASEEDVSDSTFSRSSPLRGLLSKTFGLLQADADEKDLAATLRLIEDHLTPLYNEAATLAQSRGHHRAAALLARASRLTQKMSFRLGHVSQHSFRS